MALFKKESRQHPLKFLKKIKKSTIVLYVLLSIFVIRQNLVQTKYTKIVNSR